LAFILKLLEGHLSVKQKNKKRYKKTKKQQTSDLIYRLKKYLRAWGRLLKFMFLSGKMKIE